MGCQRIISFLIDQFTPAAPVPNNTIVDAVYTEDEKLVAGKEGVILVPFHSNPNPENITWYMSDTDQGVWGNNINNNAYGRYTAEGFEEYVSY